MTRSFKMVSIIKRTLLLLCLLSFSISAFSQEPFNNQTVVIEGYEFMPYCKGEVIKNFEGRNSASMEKIYNAIISWDKLNPPKGIEARFRGSDNVLEIYFAAYINLENSKTVKSGASLQFFINDPTLALGFPLIYNIFLEPIKVAEFYGFPIYQTTNSEVTIITKINSPLFINVTQGEYLQALIDAELKKEKSNPNQPPVSDSQKILTEMEKAYNELLKIDKSAAEELKKEIQNFKKDMADTNFDNSNPLYLLESYKKELEKLSPAERAKPARYSIAAMEKYGNISGLVPGEFQYESTNLVKLAPEFTKFSNNYNSLNILAIRWNVGEDNSTSDKPRVFDGDTTGFGLADYYMANLYKQKSVWDNIFKLLNF